MIKIHYPDKKPLVKIEEGRELIFCLIRKKWLLITPEEWVRQNFLLYLVEVLNYPASLIAVEKKMQIAELQKRFDIVVYKNSLPFLLVECKEMNVPVTQNTLEQAIRYNAKLQAGYFVLTNGTSCWGFKKEAGTMMPISALPPF